MCGHMHTLAMEDSAILLPFFGRGERADFDPIVNGDLRLIALVVGFELMGFYLDSNIVLTVLRLRALACMVLFENNVVS